MKNVPAFLCCVFGLALGLHAQEALPKTTLECDHLDMWSVGNETHGVCKDSVVLTGTNLRIVCDRLEFVALGVEDKSSTVPALDKFKYMVATGHVVIEQSDRVATCGRAEVLPHDDKVILTEQPQLVDRATGWKTDGEKIVMLRGERHVIVEKSRVTGPAIRDLGYDKAKTPAPAEAPAKPAPAK